MANMKATAIWTSGDGREVIEQVTFGEGATQFYQAKVDGRYVTEDFTGGPAGFERFGAAVTAAGVARAYGEFVA